MAAEDPQGPRARPGERGLRNYFERATKSMRRTNYWQILQFYEESGQPGVYRAWVLQNNTLQHVTINSQRVIYLNARRPDETLEKRGKKVTKTLPHARPCLHLYELAMDEAEYAADGERTWRFVHSNIEHIRGTPAPNNPNNPNNRMSACCVGAERLLTLLASDEYEGVYEGKVPLLFRLVCDVGCVCRLAPTADWRKGVFGARDLQFKSTADCPYLPGEGDVCTLFLFQSRTEGRGLVVLLIPHLRRAYSFTVFPGNARDLDAVNFRTVLAAVCKSYLQDDPSLDDAQRARAQALADMKFDSSTVRSEEEAWEGVRSLLLRYKQTEAPPSILLHQTPSSSQALCALVPGLRGMFPLAPVPYHEGDSAYPALGWCDDSLLFVCRICLLVP